MNAPHADNDTTSLFTDLGERKYLNASECKRFIASLSVLKTLCEQTFCETIYWTGCRPSEALKLDVMRVNVEDCFLVFRSLKKHGKKKGKHFRTVPIPPEFAARLNEIHSILKTQLSKSANPFRRLWRFGRQKGWRLIKIVMDKAGIFGVRACARGLRHSFGVHTILSGIAESKLQTWLGHEDPKTTAIYLTIGGAEDHELIRRMWNYRAI